MGTHRFTAVGNASLDALYADAADHDLQPLWPQEHDLMQASPPAKATAHVWRWSVTADLARRSGAEIDFDSGGDRRVFALANPGLGGLPYATPTLWGGLQYLNPGEIAPAHRHSPGAFRFVLEGDGVWTTVDGDEVAMHPGDLVLTPSLTWHEHHNAGSDAMIWFDGLDLPFVAGIDAVFFEQRPPSGNESRTPAISASEHQYGGGPGLVPVCSRGSTDHSPLLAYRWAATDAALDAQLAQHGQDHAAVRFVDPTSGRDVLPTMRGEMHRVIAGHRTPTRKEAGSSIWVCFQGEATLVVDGTEFTVEHGDIVAVPSWAKFDMSAESHATLFRLSDAPVFEATRLARHVEYPTHQAAGSQ